MHSILEMRGLAFILATLWLAIFCLNVNNAWVLPTTISQQPQQQEHRTQLLSRVRLVSGGGAANARGGVTAFAGTRWTPGPRAVSTALAGGKIEEFVDDEVVADDGGGNSGKNENDGDTRTDEEKGLTHGYEGDFKVGDVVKVKTCPKIWSVKAYSKEGFSPVGLVGKVQSLVLYGRKFKSLCSAITPIKVEFQPDDASVAASVAPLRTS